MKIALIIIAMLIIVLVIIWLRLRHIKTAMETLQKRILQLKSEIGKEMMTAVEQLVLEATLDNTDIITNRLTAPVEVKTVELIEKKDVIVELYNGYDPERKLHRLDKEKFFFGAVNGYYGDHWGDPLECESAFKAKYEYGRDKETKKLFYDGFELGRNAKIEEEAME